MTTSYSMEQLYLVAQKNQVYKYAKSEKVTDQSNLYAHRTQFRKSPSQKIALPPTISLYNRFKNPTSMKRKFYYLCGLNK